MGKGHLRKKMLAIYTKPNKKFENTDLGETLFWREIFSK